MGIKIRIFRLSLTPRTVYEMSHSNKTDVTEDEDTTKVNNQTNNQTNNSQITSESKFKEANEGESLS